MARLRDSRTGVVVDVDDATAEALPTAYEPVKAPAKKSTPSKSSK